MMVSTVLLASVCSAQAQDDPWELDLDESTADGMMSYDRSLVPRGVSLGPIGGASGVGLAQASVVGGDGGTTMWSGEARVRSGSWVVAALLPFATFRDAGGRATGLGNLRLSVMALNAAHSPTAHFGLELRVPVGETHTWVDDIEDMWPGTGLHAVYGRAWTLGSATAMLRASAGVHLTQGYAPVPATVLRAELAGALDHPLSDSVGAVAELSVAYWDPTPADLAALVRVDPMTGLRFRGGISLPVLSWAGAQPARVPAGVREATLHIDVSTTMF